VDAQGRSRQVIDRAKALGFDLCGVAPAADFEELARLPEWLERGYAGEMRYLEDPRRRSPAAALQGASSIIVCALQYNTPHPRSTELPFPVDGTPPRGWISRYAWGDDYHSVLGEKLNALLASMRAEFVDHFEARAYVDTGPLVERIAAKYAGIGWLGKNTCLIHPELGSWIILGAILTTLDLAPTLAPQESPLPDLCGQCRLCLEACPTGALVEPYVLDARRCISYLTIELRGPIPEPQREGLGRHVFGCDICQDVCPWNHQAPLTRLAAFAPRKIENRKAKIETCEEKTVPELGSLFAPELEWLASLSEVEFREVFRNSAVKRTKWRGLVRNACVALGNAASAMGPQSRDRIADLLHRLAASGDELIAEHARWALMRIQPAAPD
jgi:epoxyqueuosine reductase